MVPNKYSLFFQYSNHKGFGDHKSLGLAIIKNTMLTYLSGFLTLNMALRAFSLESACNEDRQISQVNVILKTVQLFQKVRQNIFRCAHLSLKPCLKHHVPPSFLLLTYKKHLNHERNIPNTRVPSRK